MVKDRDTQQPFEGEEADWLLRRVLSQRIYDDGLLCRLDDRGDPVVQLSPPLIADQELLGRICDIVGEAVEYAWGEVQKGMPAS
jgi:adenosylmethionine-8-amino-7-oxononanoate aminotransferase